MPVTWQEYLKVPDADRQYAECHRRCRASFQKQRENIERLLEAISPRVVACLGAGVLNDIPYQPLIRSGADIHLVDWLEDAPQAGVGLSIIETDQAGQPACLYCDPAVTAAEKYCSVFQPKPEPTARVCDHFTPCPGDPTTCAAFAVGELPVIHCADVTGGYASEFGGRIVDELQPVRTWKDAFSKATGLADRLATHRLPLPIDDGSVDLVTSSMVVSQFVHEPYDYFSRRTAELLGPPATDEEPRLRPAMHRLRSSLLSGQMRGHCEEIQRILAPGGLCYLSFEMFDAEPGMKQWQLIEGMAKVLEAIGRYFYFNFDIIPEQESITRFQTPGGSSLVLSVVLESKPG